MAEIKLNINWDDLHEQIGKLVSSGAGMATGAAGAAGGGGGANRGWNGRYCRDNEFCKANHGE